MSLLLSPIVIGDLKLKNRVVLAPLTRARADPNRNPNDLMREYYEQRCGAGLIITEAVAVSEQGFGWFGTAGIYTDEHAKEWSKIVTGVKSHGTKIFLQLWHMGRQSHSSFHESKEILAPSAIRIPGDGKTRDKDYKSTPFEIPREMTIAEIDGVVQDFKQAAKLSKQAGFDGVEILGGGGYLIDSFLQSTSNHRTDEYGGSAENRFRILKEIVEAVLEVFPANRVSVKITSNGSYGGMGSVDNYASFTYYAAQLSQYGLAWLTIMDGPGFGAHDLDRHLTLFDFKTAFKGPILGAVGWTQESAEGAIRSGAADLISFGRAYISNPDLAERFEKHLPLRADPPREHWWTPEQGAEGYTDYTPYDGSA